MILLASERYAKVISLRGSQDDIIGEVFWGSEVDITDILGGHYGSLLKILRGSHDDNMRITRGSYGVHRDHRKIWCEVNGGYYVFSGTYYRISEVGNITGLRRILWRWVVHMRYPSYKCCSLPYLRNEVMVRLLHSDQDQGSVL